MSNWFYIDANGQYQGPVDNRQLKSLAINGIITPETILITDNGKKGAAGKLRGLFDAPAAPIHVAAPPVNQAVPSGMPNLNILSLIEISIVEVRGKDVSMMRHETDGGKSIVKIVTDDANLGVSAERAFINQKFPGCEIVNQSLTEIAINGEPTFCDVITARTETDTWGIVFDISSFFASTDDTDDVDHPLPGGGRAVASLVWGIISLIVLIGSPLLTLIFSIIGLISGILGLKSRRRGIAIAGICVSAVAMLLVILFMMPAIQMAREAARRMQCANHQRQIMLALHTFHDTHGAFPPLHTVDDEGNPLHSWRVLILPFIEQHALYDAIMSSGAIHEPWDSEINKQFHDKMPNIFRCPSNPRTGCCYSVIAREGFVPATKAGERTGLHMGNIPDGVSNTLAIVEVKEPFNWMDPTADITLDELARGINVSGGACWQ